MSNLENIKKDLVVALDIGTTKVCAVAGYKNEHDKIEVKGFGKVESDGVLRGVVTNIDKVVKAIKDAVTMAQRSVDFEISNVHVGIAGQHIKSIQHRGILTREASLHEISQKDIDNLVKDMHRLVLPPGDKILHVIPQEYTVDNEQGIVDPIGMSGIRLEANFHIITGQQTASNNIKRCVSKAGLNIGSITLEPIASSAAVLRDDEKEAGIVLVDIGGGTTDITIFKEGIIRHTAVIPLGGNIITKDIKEGCRIMLHQAEKLKIKFGAALAEEVYENRIITIPGLQGRDHKEISEVNLAKIIQARAEEIFDFVYYEITNAGFDPMDLIGGIVLTGGGSLLLHIDKLAEYMTGMSCRKGIPVEQLAHGYKENMMSPQFSTALGLLMLGIETADKHQNIPVQHPVSIEKPEVVELENTEINDDTTKKKSFLDRFFEGTKEFFAEKEDVEM